MKVLLIAPPDNKVLEPFASSPIKPTPLLWGFPLGLGYLAAYLKKNGHEPLILDCLRYDYSLSIIKKKIQKIKPDLVGIMIMTPWARSAATVAKIIKEVDKELPVIGGGPHAAFDYENLLKNYNFDYIVIGEGEVTLLKLVDYLAKKRGKKRRKILGIAYRQKGKVYVNPPRSLISNLDEIPFPARELVKFEDYITNSLLPQAVEIIGSRGCSHRCAFCSSSHFWKRWRARSPENIIEEIKALIKKYPQIKSFLFYDDNFTLDKERIIHLCRLLIAEGLNRYYWSCLGRADQVDEEMLALMKKAGCQKISYGVESGSPKILKNVDKYLDLSKVRETIRITRKVGIEALAFFMIGNPGETEATIKQSIRFAKRLKPTSTAWSITQVLPGTKIAAMQPVANFIEYQYDPEIDKPYPFLSPFIPTFDNKGMDREKLKRIHRRVFRYFTFHHLLDDPLSRVRHFFYSPSNGLSFLYSLFRR